MLLFVLTRDFLIVLELIVLTETVNDVTRLPKQNAIGYQQCCYQYARKMVSSSIAKQICSRPEIN